MVVPALFWVFQITVGLWILAEIVLQVVQFRRGARARTTEWRSLGAIVLGIALGDVLAGLARRFVPVLAAHIPWVVAFSVALPVLWFGIGFRLWAMRTLGQFFRGVVHVQEGHRLVSAGPYRMLRHPSYTGALIAVVGICLLFNNFLAMIAFAGCAFAGIYYRIRVEERVLIEGLGAEYAEYRKHTKRLIPGVW